MKLDIMWLTHHVNSNNYWKLPLHRILLLKILISNTYIICDDVYYVQHNMRLYNNIIWYDLGGVVIWKLEKVKFPRTERDTLKINVIVLKNVSVWLNTTTIQYNNWNPTSPMFERRRPHSDGGKRKTQIGLQYSISITIDKSCSWLDEISS